VIEEVGRGVGAFGIAAETCYSDSSRYLLGVVVIIMVLSAMYGDVPRHFARWVGGEWIAAYLAMGVYRRRVRPRLHRQAWPVLPLPIVRLHDRHRCEVVGCEPRCRLPATGLSKNVAKGAPIK
jgi:hypothetical protein